MQKVTNPSGLPSHTGALFIRKERVSKQAHWIMYAAWACALLIFVVSCIFMSFHHTFFPLDLSTTRDIQSLHLPGWLNAIVNFPSSLNNPVPSIVALILWVLLLVVGGFIARARGKSPRAWWFAALFLALAVQAAAGLNVVIDELVNRKRPLPSDGIRVVGSIVPFPTYPSGHTEHDMVYYGFLLYLSFTRHVRQWRYHWLLLPLQIYAIFDMLAIGFSRVELGDHWLTDVLGGYLEGIVYLCLFIFLYHLADRLWLAYQARKASAHNAS